MISPLFKTATAGRVDQGARERGAVTRLWSPSGEPSQVQRPEGPAQGLRLGQGQDWPSNAGPWFPALPGLVAQFLGSGGRILSAPLLLETESLLQSILPWAAFV